MLDQTSQRPPGADKAPAPALFTKRLPERMIASPMPVAFSAPASVNVPPAVAVNAQLDESRVRLLMSFNRTFLPD